MNEGTEAIAHITSAAAISPGDQEEAIKRIAHAVSAMLRKFVQKLGGSGEAPQAIQQQGQQMTGNEQVIQAQAKRKPPWHQSQLKEIIKQ